MRPSFTRILDHVPIKTLSAFTQTVVGFGAGLLIAEKLKRPVRHKTAAALFGAGIAASLPIIISVVTHLVNGPESKRTMRKRLESIRRDITFSGEDGF
ncbi:MAG: hypothetical protein ABIP97_04245 [Chthoniobacterales bacterium]